VICWDRAATALGLTLSVEFPQDNRIAVKKGSAGIVILA
jgi:hypothetical protein